MKLNVDEMTDEQLLEAYKKGCVWLTDQEQITNTNKNRLGEPYKHKAYLAGLRRIENIGDELTKRGIKYGR